MKDHPIFVPLYRHPFIFSYLVDVHFELGTKYWIEFPNALGRCRLTNVKTGHYVIYGNHSVMAGPRDIGYADEHLWRNIPGPVARVKVGERKYEYITLTNPRDLPSIQVGKYESTLCVIFLEDATGLTYDYGTLRADERVHIRSTQYQILDAYRSELADDHHPAELFNKKVLSGPLF